MSKQQFGILLLLVLGITISFPIIGSESAYKNVTITNLEQEILLSNLTIKEAEAKVALSEIQMNHAIANRNNKGDSELDKDLNKEYNPFKTKNDYNYEVWLLEKTKEDIIVDGVEQYYGYLFLIDEIEIHQHIITRLENALDMVNKKIELGTATESDRIKAEIDLEESRADLTELLFARDKAFMELNHLMNYSLDTSLILDEIDVPYEEYEVKDLEADLALVMTNDGELMKAQNDYEAVVLKEDIYSDHNLSDKYDATIDALKLDIINLEFGLKEKELTLEMNLRNKYNDLLSNRDAVRIDELEYENKQMAYDVMKSRYEVGLQTQADVDLAQENLDFAKLDYEKAKLDYYVAVQEYKNFID